MRTIRWTTTATYILHLDDDQQREWEALDAAGRDAWLADREDDPDAFDAVTDREYTD